MTSPTPSAAKAAVEAVYPLTSTQEGMLLECLRDEASHVFVEQVAVTLEGDLDGDAIERAWPRVVRRHAALRTAIAWKTQERPVQVVAREVRTALERLDWSAHDLTSRREAIDAWFADQRRAGLPLSRPPLARAALARVGHGSFVLALTFHHLVLDGWCVPLIVRDLVAEARAERGAGRPLPPPGTSFREYVAWRRQQDCAVAEEFWRGTLAGLGAPSLPGRSDDDGGPEPRAGWADVDRDLDAATSDGIRALARSWRVSTSAVVQTLWSLLLARYAEAGDVVFGVTVSGRPPEIPGIDDALGMFVQTFPARVRVRADEPVAAVASRLHALNTSWQGLAHTPTERLPAWAGLAEGRPLYETALVFQNYPQEVGDGSVRVGEVRYSGGRTRLALALLVVPGDRVALRAVVDAGRISASDAARVLEDLERLARAVAARPELEVGAAGSAVPGDGMPRVRPRRGRARPAGTPPRTAVEAAVARAWEDVLGVSGVGTTDEFLDLGGHSLAAVRLQGLLADRLGARLSLAAILTARTVEGMAKEVARVSTRPTVGGPPPLVLEPERRHEPFPLLDLQHAYWIGETRFYGFGGMVAHAYAEFDVRGLDPDRLRVALDRVVARHEGLRMVVRGDGTQQVLAEVPTFPLVVEDLRHLPADTRGARLAELRRLGTNEGPPTSGWPLLRVRATRIDAVGWRVHVAIPLVACDGRGAQVMYRDLAKCLADPDAALEPPGLSLRDYVLGATRARERALDEAWAYWRPRLATLPPAPELPVLDAPASAEGGHALVRRTGRLDPGAWTGLRACARANGIGINAVLARTWADVLATFSRSPRFTLNVLYANRAPLHPGVDELLVNTSATVALEVDGREGTFVERATRLQRQLWSDLEHGTVSSIDLGRALHRATERGRRPVFPVVFASTVGDDAAGDSVPLPEGWEAVYDALQTPQVWIDHNVFQRGGALVWNWDVAEGLFPPGLVDDMFGAYLAQLRRLVEDPASWRAELDIELPAAQVARRAASAAATGPVDPRRLHEPTLGRAASDPDAPAVLAPGKELTYGRLVALAEGLAPLLARWAGRNELVAIVMDKGWEQLVAALAVHVAGAAYLPIDARLPQARIRHLLDRGRVRVALTQPGEATWLPSGVERVVVTDEERARTAPQPGSNEDLAYVLFTSGSTGEPKGVVIDHRGALNTVLDVNRAFGVGPSDRVLALSSFGFDLSVYDVYGLLAAGGAVVLPSAEGTRDPAHWLDLARARGVTVWNSVPALVDLFVTHLESVPDPSLPPLRLVLMSGDWIPVTLPDRLRRFFPDVRVVSLGGATEASIWSIWYPIDRVDPAWKSIPYGRAMTNQSMHVLDASFHERPDHVPGDLYIGGIGVARGYWRDPERTEASFPTHPRTGERLYRTGDLGRWLPSGDIEFLGREDHQVKVHGYRIELGEIEAALGRHPGVLAAAVVAVGDARADRRLVGHVVPAGAELDPEDLRRHLRALLPEYMVPATFRSWDALPLSSNGKVDRGRLEEAPAVPPRATAGRAPADALEETLLAVFREILGDDGVSVEDDFFERGGSSLAAVRLVNRARERSGRAVGMAHLFEGRSVAGTAAALRRASRASPLLVMAGAGAPGRAFHCVHAVGGSALAYRGLAARVGEDRPFVGVQCPEDPPSTLEELARGYVAALRASGAEAPYLLGGWSMGGVVAFEMARQLAEAGEEVGLVVLVDSGAPEREDDPDDEATLRRRFERDLVGTGRHDAELEPAFRTFRSNQRALATYRRSQARFPVAAVRAEASPDGGWGALCERYTEAVIPGDHYSILDPARIDHLASTLRARLDAADPGGRHG